MEFSEEWKSLWPISLPLTPAPLLLDNVNLPSFPSLGPLFFNPVPNTITTLYTSLSTLCPPVHPTLPSLSLPRFLQVATSPHSPLLQSTSTIVASSFGTNHHQDSSVFDHNRIEHLRCPGNRFIVFFPTGENLDRVGFVVLVAGDEGFQVGLDVANKAFVSGVKFDHRIVRLRACGDDCFSPFACYGNVGFLMACTMHSVHWFSFKLRGAGEGSEDAPVLEYMGGKLFKGSVVADACWNPCVPGECVVLLENGDLFLFDVYCFPPPELSGLYAKLGGKRLRLFWDELGGYTKNGWFSCVFSALPSLLIVANSSAVFLVNFKFEKSYLSCLLKIEKLIYNSIIGMDRFVAVSEAGPDSFHFTCATEHMLLLCDVRKPLSPLLQWHHGVREPRHLASFRLSDIRSNPNNVEHKWASENGFGILVGSFWNDDFALFCYGPHPPPYAEFPSSIALRPPSPEFPSSTAPPTPSPKFPSSTAPKCGNSFCSWELPSHLSLSSSQCFCGSCLLRLEFAKDDLPSWIQWQQKKELVLGFFIVDNSYLSFKSDDHGGFTLIRLMSSGKLESQRYHASWNMLRVCGTLYGEAPLNPTGSFLYPMGDEKYKFRRRFHYLKFDLLYSHLNDVLSNNLLTEYKEGNSMLTMKENSRADLHELLCEKLKASRFDVSMSSCSVSDLFRGISMPTSINEVAFRRAWTTLPMHVLELAFSNYSGILDVLTQNYKKTSLDFLAVPQRTGLPPFLLRNPPHRSNKWSSKVKRGDDYVGPVLPLPVCLVLGQIQRHGLSQREKVYKYSFNTDLALQCDALISAAKQVALLDSGCDHLNESAISLGDDGEETQNGLHDSLSFFMYEPTALCDGCSVEDGLETGPSHEDRRFKLTIAELHVERANGAEDLDGMKLFDDLCPVKLSFNTQDINFDDKELKTYQLLKRHFSTWQVGFTPYKDFCSRLEFKKHGLC